MSYILTKTPINEITRKNFAFVRKEYGISQKQIADAAKVSVSTIWRFETKIGRPYTEDYEIKKETEEHIINALKKLIDPEWYKEEESEVRTDPEAEYIIFGKPVSQLNKEISEGMKAYADSDEKATAEAASSMEFLNAINCNLNKKLHLTGSITKHDFYDALGIPYDQMDMDQVIVDLSIIQTIGKDVTVAKKKFKKANKKAN